MTTASKKCLLGVFAYLVQGANCDCPDFHDHLEMPRSRTDIFVIVANQIRIPMQNDHWVHFKQLKIERLL